MDEATLANLRTQIETLKTTKSYANTAYVSGYIDALVESKVLSSGFAKIMNQPDIMLDSLNSMYESD
ncbi:hypothetical protein [uncultured Deefgea sp.]|uniref:hypothetical protein n=1 Tax=uncultured Deefgea sp. TaxID=1304914 RepID=UPI0026040374|nr:hypothetical protein [uncultured Deefgea sp.]